MNKVQSTTSLVQYIKIISDKVMCWKYKAIKMTSLKAVLNWEASFKCKLEKELTCGKVVKVRCVICAKYESQIKNIKRFSTSWITGMLSVKKDSLEKHLESNPKKPKTWLQKDYLDQRNTSKKWCRHHQLGRG